MHPALLLSIAAGGAIGAVLRHLLGLLILRQTPTLTFPLPTLAVNVLGAFVLGLLVSHMALTWSPNKELRAFLTIGLLGGFTTFSTFCAETILLWERGEMGMAATYVTLSFFLSLTAFVGGGLLGRAWV